MALTIHISMTEGDEDLVPQRKHETDAGYDLHSRVETCLASGTRELVPTGLFIALPDGFEAQVRPRSGLAIKHGITVLNSPGTIDAGYRGEVGVVLYNTAQEPFQISRGDRIAQMVVHRISDAQLELVTELSHTDRGEGGFGSTGM